MGFFWGSFGWLLVLFWYWFATVLLEWLEGFLLVLIVWLGLMHNFILASWYDYFIMVELDAIFARRSIRKYTSEPVSDEDVKKLLEAAMAAPSGGNKKPWHFITVTNRETLDRLEEEQPYGRMLREAPLCIIVCYDPSHRTPQTPQNFVSQDCSAATMNILHAAVALGLGAVWLGAALGAHELLGVPDNIIPHNMIVVGHPAEDKEPRTQYDEARVHKELW